MRTPIAAWRRWQAAAGPWRGYVVCPALQVGLAATVTPTPPPRFRLDQLFAHEATAVLVDIDPLDGVALAAEAHSMGVAHAVIVLPRWPHSQAVLPCEELVAALVGASSRLTGVVRTSNVLFVLDVDRRRSIAPRPRADPRVDNRYEIAPRDLPDLATLRRAGIRRIVRLTRVA